MIHSRIFEDICHVCAQCSASLKNPLDYSPKDGIHFDSVNIKCSKSNSGLTIRTIHVENADITWTQGVVRLKCFSLCNIISLDVHEDMSLYDCGTLTVSNWNSSKCRSRRDIRQHETVQKISTGITFLLLETVTATIGYSGQMLASVIQSSKTISSLLPRCNQKKKKQLLWTFIFLDNY